MSCGNVLETQMYKVQDRNMEHAAFEFEGHLHEYNRSRTSSV